MKLCDDSHEEIVYVGKYCPLCETLSNLAELQIEFDKIHEELESLKNKE